MFKVLYYHYYLFYKKVLVQSDPHFVTILALSASEGFLINGMIDLIAIKFYCSTVGQWPMLGVFLTLLIVNFFNYGRNEGDKIVKDKPTFFGSKKSSIGITLIFFLITTSWLFWGAVLGRHLLEQCR